jgi:formylmethanofuran dehydrogenase subunit B
MWSTEAKSADSVLTCPFCGLACDDLSVAAGEQGTKVDARGCGRAARSFSEALGGTSASAAIRGQPAPLDQVIDHSAALLRGASAPLFAGLTTDVNGMRAMLELAERCGAVLDHLNGDALFRNLLVLQEHGWLTGTFAEVRNRADLILVAGTECFERFPRLSERLLYPPDALFSPPRERQLVLIGPWADRQTPAELPKSQTTVLPLDLKDLAGLMGILRGLLAKRPLQLGGGFAGIATERLADLAERLRGARYSVLVWSAAELAFPHAELTVRALVELVRDLNEETRAAALPLAGSLGDVTANQVCTWQTGYPLRSGFQQGGPRYEPILYRHQDLLSRGETDLLLWISALSPAAGPPSTQVPTILLGNPGTAPAEPVEAFIPVGIPGIDHPGHWYRSDTVCTLPLGRVRDSTLLPAAEVLHLLKKRL